jgi:hypothetical protein
MIAMGLIYFNMTLAIDASLAPLNTPDHPRLILVSRKILYNQKGRPAQPPRSIQVMLSGFSIVTQSVEVYSSVRLKLAVAGFDIYAGPNDGSQYKPDADGFHVVICVDAGCQVDSIQCNWIASWD